MIAEAKKKFISKESVARCVFAMLAAFSVLAVFTIVGYLLYASVPAFKRSGVLKFIFGSEWSAKWIWRMIAGTFVLTICATLFGGTLAVFTAIWLVFYCPRPLKKIYTQIVNLLAGIPSIVYGLFGYKFLMPLLVKIFHPNNAGFGLLFPAAKSGVISAVILGIGRAIGETMAVQMIVGNGSGYPSGAFVPFTTLTSNIVQNWGYAAPAEQAALIADGFVLLVLILLLNVCLTAVKKPREGNKFFSRRIRESENREEVRSYRRTGSAQDILFVISWMVAVIVAFILAFVVAFVFVKGVPYLSFDFLFGKSGNAHTTLAPAFVSTIMLVGLALLIALPLGVGAAIYLNEYAKKNSRFVKIVRLFVDTLAGIPSIVFGLFGMVFFVKGLGFGYSLRAGGITLALIILPTVIRSTEQSLSEVPDSMRETSNHL